jgi:hypothetical protein
MSSVAVNRLAEGKLVAAALLVLPPDEAVTFATPIVRSIFLAEQHARFSLKWCSAACFLDRLRSLWIDMPMPSLRLAKFDCFCSCQPCRRVCESLRCFFVPFVLGGPLLGEVFFGSEVVELDSLLNFFVLVRSPLPSCLDVLLGGIVCHSLAGVAGRCRMEPLRLREVCEEATRMHVKVVLKELRLRWVLGRRVGLPRRRFTPFLDFGRFP